MADPIIINYSISNSVTLKSYNRDKRVQRVSRGVFWGGVKGIRLISMGKGPGESVVHGPRTSLLRHWAFILQYHIFIAVEQLHMLAGIPSAELRRRAANVALSRRAMDPDHLLHNTITREKSHPRL